MMKRMVAIVLSMLLALSLTNISVAEEAEESPFDNFAARYPSSLNPAYDIDKLQAVCTLTPGEISQTDDDIVRFFANAWYNLYYYEINTEGIPLEETYAAEIYEGLLEGPAVMVFTASKPDSQFATILVARNNEYAGNAYWIEWDLKNQHLKAVRKIGVEHYAADDEFLNDYVFSACVLNSIGGNIIINTGNQKDSIVKAYGSDAGLTRALDQIYSHINNDEVNPLKHD